MGKKKRFIGIMLYQFPPMTLSHLCSSCCCVFSALVCLHQKSSVKRNSVNYPASSQLEQPHPLVYLVPALCVQHCVHSIGAASVELQGQKRVQLTVRRARITVGISTLLSSSCVTDPQSWESRSKKCLENGVMGLDIRLNPCMPPRDNTATSLGGLSPLVLLLMVSSCVYGVAPVPGTAQPCCAMWLRGVGNRSAAS